MKRYFLSFRGKIPSKIAYYAIVLLVVKLKMLSVSNIQTYANIISGF